MRKTSKSTEQKYFNALIELKNGIENNENFKITEFLREKNLSNGLSRSLQSLGIIKNLSYGKHSRFQWNEKIPVTMILTKRVMKECNDIHKETLSKSKNNASNLEAQKIETVKTKTVRRRKKIQEVESVKQIGIIRKFFRWLY
jgi:uncharacterized protein YajQ (UPF0234 family)